MSSFYLFTTSPQRSNKCSICINMFKTNFRQMYSSKHIEISCLYLDFSFICCTMYIREFKQRRYQIYKADYCLKHFKLVIFMCFCNDGELVATYWICSIRSIHQVYYGRQSIWLVTPGSVLLIITPKYVVRRLKIAC